MELTLYKQSAPTTPWLTIKAFTYSDQDMGETMISADIYTPQRIEVVTLSGETNDWLGAFVEFRGETFTIAEPPTRVKDNTRREYKYSVKLAPQKRKLKGWYFSDFVTSGSDAMYTGLAIVHFFGNVTEFAGRLAANLAHREAGLWNVYVKEGTPDDLFVEFSFDKVTIWDALTELHNQLKVPFKIAGGNIYLGEWGDEITGHDFTYGMGNGLYSLTRTPVAETMYNRIIPVGGERNVPLNYYRSFAPLALHTPFLMPKEFRDTSGSKWWYDIAAGVGTTIPISEIFVQYEDIYPSIRNVLFNSKAIDQVKSIGDIGSDELEEDGTVVDSYYYMYTNAFGFNPLACLAAKEEMYIEMTSGACAGCRFRVLGINGKSLNKYDYINNLIIKPRSITEMEVTNLAAEPYEEILAAYDNLIVCDIKISEVKFGTGDIIHNNIHPDKTLSFLMGTYLVNREKELEILLSTHAATLAPETSGYAIDLLGTSVFIPETTLDDLATGLWEMVSRISFTLSDTTEANVQFGKARLSAQFSNSDPTIKNIVTIKETEPPTPSLEDNVFTLQKDIETFNTLMPNAAQKPATGDTFIITGIELPESYIQAAELAVENKALSELTNLYGVQKYTYSLSLDQKYVALNESDIYDKLKCSNTMFVDGIAEALRITQVSISYKESSLFPEYNITLSNTTKPITGALNAISRQIKSLDGRTIANISSAAALNKLLAANLARIEAIAQNTISSLGIGGVGTSQFVKKSGDTMTGDLFLPKVIPDTLVIPEDEPALSEGEYGLTMSESGFTGEIPPEGLITAIVDLDDVTVLSVADQDALVWDDSTSKFVNKKVALHGHNHDDRYYTQDEIDTMFTGVTIDAYTKSEADMRFHPIYGLNEDDEPLDLSADILVMKTLVLPSTSPEIEEGQYGLTISNAGFTGEIPEEEAIEGLSDLVDVSITTPANGEVLMFNGTIWVNQEFTTISSWNDILDKPETFPPASHNHDSSYAPASHNHDSSYAPANHNHDSAYAAASHNHDSSYAASSHNHDSTYAKLSGATFSGGISVPSITIGSYTLTIE